MDQAEASDPRYHYLVALAHLATGNAAAMEEACQRASVDIAFRRECDYLLGLASLDRQELHAAAASFARVAGSDSPSAAHARAQLGKIKFLQGEYERAVENWKMLEPDVRSRWELQQPLANMVFLAALQAFQENDFQKAAARIREAGRLGVKDRRLGALLALALLKAGQQLLYESGS
jgi:hypothetical protein